MNAPTDRQLDILRAMAAGLRLEHEPNGFLLTLRHSPAAAVKPETVALLEANGWIQRKPATCTWELTRDGLAHAECKTFVRAFCEAVPVSA